jgi:2-oxoacid:acceptor oxidoreductase delta subunit (pyruvate/2-ketoisovalerate family)
MLHDVADGDAPMLGRRVVVYGGGNTAVDAARTARRLGATESIIVYRRTRDRMPAHDSEVVEALEEGVTFRWLSTITHADAGHLMVERMELDDTGFPQPTGELEDLEADSLVLALGQETDLSLLDGVPDLTFVDGVVQIDDKFMTGHPGIFAGGDVVPAQRTVTVGIGHGARAAEAIHSWLADLDDAAPVESAEPSVPPLAEYADLNTWYFSDAPHAVRPRLEAARRASGFDEVVQSLDPATALYEARRCMSCGNCFECDNCYGVCPDNAVIKLGVGEGFRIDYDYCKGCGICATECPAGAIRMVPEPTVSI